ncbi:AlwI family type II restriction endonuclease [Neisseria weixii]|uniref:AlwI family type II restriction endonuclease n=1 Tax=Neisseria weixii TaxID=1853276 RepID=UPI0035A06386
MFQNTDTLKFFYNFRFAMLFLNQYDDVPRHDFLHILESISPEFTKEDLDLIITAYKQVVDGIQSFEEYYNQYFAYKISTTEDIDKVKQLFLSGTISKENLVNIFKNGKSPQPLYADFVLNIIELIDKREVNSLTELKKLSKLSIIKKAFGLNKMPFKFTNGETVSEFLEQNADNSLLSDNHYEIYLKFISSKRFDLIREYSDMCQRIFSVTGMISFSKGLVNLNNKWLMKPLLEQISNRFILCGHGNYEKYEENINSSWFADISLCEIFEISEKECQAILRGVQKDFDISDVAHIKSAIRGRKEEYRTFVAQNFPKEKLIEVLEHISSRNDNQVFNLVTDNATIPTIFEYILTIAWYHISKRKFYLKQAFQVSLDGNKLPLTHRGSGAGDIEILTKDYALLIEATLMDKNTQKRGELEPVIRHSINFNLQHFDRVPNIQTLFIANELDGNVINLFRAVQFIELNGTLSNKESVNGISILALTTTDIIIALKNDLNDEEILSRIKEQRMKKPDWIKSDWYQSARCTVLGV